MSQNEHLLLRVGRKEMGGGGGGGIWGYTQRLHSDTGLIAGHVIRHWRVKGKKRHTKIRHVFTDLAP